LAITASSPGDKVSQTAIVCSTISAAWNESGSGCVRQKWNHRLLLGGGHLFEQDLEVIHLGDPDAEMARKPIAHRGLSSPGRSTKE